MPDVINTAPQVTQYFTSVTHYIVAFLTLPITAIICEMQLPVMVRDKMWMLVSSPPAHLITPYKQGNRITGSSDYESVQVFIAVDVGKDILHTVVVKRSG